MGISTNTLSHSGAKSFFVRRIGWNRPFQSCSKISAHASVQSLQLDVAIAVLFRDCIGNLVLGFGLQKHNAFLLVLSDRVQPVADGLQDTLPRLFPPNVKVCARFVSVLFQFDILPLLSRQTGSVILILVTFVNFIYRFLELKGAKLFV